jgi:protein-S-isoprenylcysteine O-methyltransferase Ste14
LIIAAIAVVLAVVTHVGNEIHQEELLAHIDSSDEYNDYQVKKSANIQLELNADFIGLIYDRLPPADQAVADKKVADYKEQQKQNAEKGQKHKEEGDAHVQEASKLAKKASILDIGEIALQISVVLCSITILTGQRLFVRMGVCVAMTGALIALWVLFLMR